MDLISYLFIHVNSSNAFAYNSLLFITIHMLYWHAFLRGVHNRIVPLSHQLIYSLQTDYMCINLSNLQWWQRWDLTLPLTHTLTHSHTHRERERKKKRKRRRRKGGSQLSSQPSSHSLTHSHTQQQQSQQREKEDIVTTQ